MDGSGGKTPWTGGEGCLGGLTGTRVDGNMEWPVGHDLIFVVDVHSIPTCLLVFCHDVEP